MNQKGSEIFPVTKTKTLGYKLHNINETKVYTDFKIELSSSNKSIIIFKNNWYNC